MRTYGLIGYPLEHSFSAGYFAEKFKKENITDAQYLNFPIENIEQFPTLFSKGFTICGLNVTIPYKEKVIPYLNELSEGAQAIKAVNTIKIVYQNGIKKLIGYNTDEFGFRQTLLSNLKNYHRNALVLGTGGASKAITYVLDTLRINYLLVSRNPDGTNQIGYHQIDASIMNQYHIIINTTPVGMYPNVDEKPPIPYHMLTRYHLLYDLIYNPLKTAFLIEGEKYGCLTMNGLGMLYLQAEKAWEIWNS